MNNLKIYSLLLLLIVCSFQIFAQTKYLTEKQGTYSYKNNSDYLGTKKAEYVAFGKAGKILSDYFFQNIPFMKQLKGFDLSVTLFGWGEENYLKHHNNYGMPGELRFDFQLFLIDKAGEGKWIVECPNYEIDINNTKVGHGSNYRFEGFSAQTDDPSLEGPLETAVDELSEFFTVFPLVKIWAPGVHLYGDGNLILFNPDRPPFWIPVTVKEVLDKMLAYYKIKEANNPFVYTYTKSVYDKMTKEELNSPAYSGGDEVVRVTADPEDNLQIMRFNKDYWDRSLPISAVHFMRMWYRPTDEFDMEEYIKDNNGHPHYGQLIMNVLPLKDLSSLIQRK